MGKMLASLLLLLVSSVVLVESQVPCLTCPLPTTTLPFWANINAKHMVASGRLPLSVPSPASTVTSSLERRLLFSSLPTALTIYTGDLDLLETDEEK